MALDSSSKGLRLLTCPEAEADLYAFRRGREPGTTVRIIRGSRCAVLDRCMAEWAAAMQFPYCFESTWPSFRQSLHDIAWRGAERVVVLVASANKVLPRAAGDFAELLRALEQYGASERPAIEVVLQTEARFCDSLIERAARADVKLGVLDL